MRDLVRPAVHRPQAPVEPPDAPFELGSVVGYALALQLGKREVLGPAGMVREAPRPIVKDLLVSLGRDDEERPRGTAPVA